MLQQKILLTKLYLIKQTNLILTSVSLFFLLSQEINPMSINYANNLYLSYISKDDLLGKIFSKIFFNAFLTSSKS